MSVEPKEWYPAGYAAGRTLMRSIGSSNESDLHLQQRLEGWERTVFSRFTSVPEQRLAECRASFTAGFRDGLNGNPPCQRSLVL